MLNNRIKIAVIIMGISFLPAAATATVLSAVTLSDGDNKESAAAAARRQQGMQPEQTERESLFPQKSLDLGKSHFTWGAETGASLDMTSHDLSTFDVDVMLGYKNSIFNLAGIGAGLHRSVHAGNNFIPVYAVLRTDFRRKPSPLFLNVQAGYSFNTVQDSETLGDFYGAFGMGVNLSQSRKANSYVILSVAYQYLSSKILSKIDFDTHYVFFAKLNIGVNF